MMFAFSRNWENNIIKSGERELQQVGWSYFKGSIFFEDEKQRNRAFTWWRGCTRGDAVCFWDGQDDDLLIVLDYHAEFNIQGKEKQQQLSGHLILQTC